MLRAGETLSVFPPGEPRGELSPCGGCSHLALSFGAEAPWIVGPNPDSIDGVINGSVSLTCDVRSHPTAEITWYKDGHILQLGEEVTVTPGMLG